MTLAASSASSLPRHHRFTVEQYHRMAETGVLRQEDRVELLNGEIIDMSPIGKEHAGIVDQLAAFLFTAAQGQAIVRVQNPIRIGDHSEPEPDLALLKHRADYYRKSLPQPEDVLLLIEVADSSLKVDRRIKVPLYAGAGISEMWLVDLDAKTVEVFRTPIAGVFQFIETFKAPSMIASQAFPGHALKLIELFPADP